MYSPYWNVVIRGGGDAIVNGVPVEMVVPTNVYSSVFQHLALIARQLGSPVLVRGIDETKGGQVAWFTVDADGQAVAAEPVLAPVPDEHATGEPGFTATPESQPPPPASTNWAPPPGDGQTPSVNGWTPPAPRRAPEASVMMRAGSAPSPARRSRVARASSGESCLHPWSTVRLAASTPAREATKSAAWASAMESEPPETASRTREPASIPASRKADSTALRVSASAR